MTASTSDAKREMLRHTLATIAYRGGKAIRDAPEGFAAFRCGSSSRSAGEILAHIGDLLDWALSIQGANRVGRVRSHCPGKANPPDFSPH